MPKEIQTKAKYRETPLDMWEKAMHAAENDIPTDEIILDFAESEWLRKRWMKQEANTPVSGDIFYAGTIPLPDIRVQINAPIDGHPESAIMFHVMVFTKAIQKLTPGENKIVGLMTFGSNLFGEGNILFLSVNSEGQLTEQLPKERLDRMFDDGNSELFQDVVSRCVCTWYGIQISLLHPQLKFVFEHPYLAPFFAKRQKSNKKHKIGYIRKHKITMADFDEALFSNRDKTPGTHVITCPIWWVIGHWRIRKGKKEWVDGYWKGVLREAKQNIDESRTREIDTEDIRI